MYRSIKFILLAFTIFLPLQFSFASHVGQKVPAIVLKSLKNNRIHTLNKFKNKVLLIDFWASWCSTCREALPQYDQLYSELKNKGFMVIGINVDEQAKKAISFLNFSPVNYLILHDKNKKALHWFNPREIPTVYLVDREGKIAYIHPGFQEEDIEKIKSEILELLENAQ